MNTELSSWLDDLSDAEARDACAGLISRLFADSPREIEITGPDGSVCGYYVPAWTYEEYQAARRRGGLLDFQQAAESGAFESGERLDQEMKRFTA